MADRDYVIVTDSTTDLPRDYYGEHDVRVIGLPYSMDGKEYVQFSENDLDIKTFYDAILNGSLPKTAQVPYERLYALFEDVAKEGKNIFYLCFSSALSGSYQTSLLAARDIMEAHPNMQVSVVDSVSASTGEGLLLHLCVKKRDEGADLNELADYANMVKHKVVHLFTVNDLNHLHRGGRVSKVSAVVGGMLGIKPVLHVNDLGELHPYAKARGKKAALDNMLRQMKAVCIPDECGEIFISSSDAQEDAEYLGNAIQKAIPQVKKVYYGSIGTVIGTHTGQGTVALFFVGNDRNIVEA